MVRRFFTEPAFRRQVITQFFKFFSVGVVTTMVDNAVYNAAFFLFGHYLISNVIAFFPALTVNFLLHRGWTFRGSTPDLKRKALFLGKRLLFLGFHSGTLYVLVELFYVHPTVAKVIVTCVYGFPSFVILFKWIFDA